jgi:DNA-directed RNA polymerase specialized sigma24 family protein
MTIPFSSDALAHLHASFLAIVLPRVLSHGRVCFRDVKCPHRRQDAIQDMIGKAWQWHLRLAEKGKDATAFPTALASYAARAVRSGSRVAGQEKANDVLSPVAQQRHHFYVGRLPDFETLAEHPLCEALLDNTKSPPDETVCFKLDFLAWLASLSERDRGIVEDLMIGERALDVANKYKISPARISQKRREFCQGWQDFRGERPADSASSSTVSIA